MDNLCLDAKPLGSLLRSGCLLYLVVVVIICKRNYELQLLHK